MIKKFSNDGFNIILTTNTVISAEFIDTIVIQNMIHQFFPIPYNSNILKFLKYWKPKKIYFLKKKFGQILLI